jgi:hypothetical protein
MSFLGFLGKTIVGGITGFVTGGPAGAVIGATTSALGGSRTLSGGGGTTAPALPQTTLGGGFRSLVPTGPWMPGTGPGPSPGQTSLPGSAAPAAMAVGAPDGKCNIRGYHLNKSRYFVNSNHWWQSSSVGNKVEKGSRCVKNRSINVANPRALRRALRRAYGFEKLAMRTIHLLHPRKGGRFGGFKRKRR